MEFEFIANAGGIFHSKNGKKILCDPWIIDGVFEGSWCHYPPLTTSIADLQDVDAIYVSHLHPDHYDERHFNFRADIPIFALDHGPGFLIKILQRDGFNNIIRIKDGETAEFEDFKVTLFAPFTKHNFHDAAIGNLIDSALVLESGGCTVLNANDNTPTPETCQQLVERFEHFDLAMINYNSAGPYPACFNNLSDTEKASEHDRLLARNFAYMQSLVETLNPTTVLPFAGAYVLGGSLHHKNPYLGTTTWDECATFLRAKLTNQTQVICLREHDRFDIKNQQSNRPYVPLDTAHMQQYIDQTLSQLVYDYQVDATPDQSQLRDDLIQAAERMLQRASRVGIEPDMDIILDLNGEPICLCRATDSKGSLHCSLDNRLLRRILDRKAHWNNAEIGCHIEFVRTPNHYSPDMHTMLQFLHL